MLIHSNLEFNIENGEVDFPKAAARKHFIKPATSLLHLKAITETSSNPKFADR